MTSWEELFDVAEMHIPHILGIIVIIVSNVISIIIVNLVIIVSIVIIVIIVIIVTKDSHQLKIRRLIRILIGSGVGKENKWEAKKWKCCCQK